MLIMTVAALPGRLAAEGAMLRLRVWAVRNLGTQAFVPEWRRG